MACGAKLAKLQLVISIFFMDYAKSLHPSPCHFPLETLINTGDSEEKMKDEGFLRISFFKKATRE